MPWVGAPGAEPAKAEELSSSGLRSVTFPDGPRTLGFTVPGVTVSRSQMLLSLEEPEGA